MVLLFLVMLHCRTNCKNSRKDARSDEQRKEYLGFFQLFPPFSALGNIPTTELLHPESCPPPISRRLGKGLDKSCFMFVSRCGLIFFLILCVDCWCSVGGFRSGKNCDRMEDLKGRVTQILSLCIQIIDNTRFKEVLDIQSHKYSIKYIIICFRKEKELFPLECMRKVLAGSLFPLLYSLFGYGCQQKISPFCD